MGMLMRLRFFVPIAVLVMASGCNDSPPEVTGMVTLDEKPLDDATIVFEAKDGKVAPATGKIQNGKYTLKVAPGEKVVRILAMRPSAKKDAVMGANPMESIVPAAY